MRLDFECYVVIDKKSLFGVDFNKYVADIALAGTTVIEFKGFKKEELINLLDIIKNYDIKKIIYNDFELLNDLPFDGIHLMAYDERLETTTKLKGITVSSMEELALANDKQIDFVYITDNVKKLAINSKHISVGLIEADKLPSYRASMLDGVIVEKNISYDVYFEINKYKNEIQKLVYHPADFELFILDYDGTLLDSMGMWRGVCSGYVKAMGFNPEPDLDESVKYLSLYDTAKFLKMAYPFKMTIEEMTESINKFVENTYPTLPLKYGAKEFLKSIKGYASIVLCSATPKVLLAPSLKAVGVYNEFDTIYSTSDLKLSKENGSGFKYVLENEDANSNRTIIVEDSVPAIIASSRLGIKTLCISDKTNVKHTEKIMEYATYYYSLERLMK